MILLLCLLLNVFIAVRLVTVGPRVTAPTEGRTFRYILRVVTEGFYVFTVQRINLTITILNV
jgi:hypothetical protein